MRVQEEGVEGCTLIELMIVRAIVGILAAIALPAYQDYIVRSKMSEPLAALAEAKTTVAEYVAANGGFPASPYSAFGINTSNRNSAILDELALEVDTGTGTVYITAEVDTCVWEGSCPTTALDAEATTVGTFSLSGGTNADGTMTWTCIPGGGTTGTAIPTKYLPANCRG